MLTIMSVAAVILIITTILDQRGIKLLWPEFNLMGCTLMIVLLLIWIAGCLFKRIKRKNLKTIAGLGMAFVVMLVGMSLATLVMQFGQIMLAHPYATISSSSGKNVVLLRGIDMGGGTEEGLAAMEARMDTRKAAIEAETGETSEDYPTGAYGYAFTAYPKVLGIFYNTNYESEGTLYRGAESESKILYEWTDEDTLRIYLENAEDGDEGEVTVRY